MWLQGIPTYTKFSTDPGGLRFTANRGRTVIPDVPEDAKAAGRTRQFSRRERLQNQGKSMKSGDLSWVSRGYAAQYNTLRELGENRVRKQIFEKNLSDLAAQSICFPLLKHSVWCDHKMNDFLD